jgi:hypothetical protein
MKDRNLRIANWLAKFNTANDQGEDRSFAFFQNYQFNDNI